MARNRAGFSGGGAAEPATATEMPRSLRAALIGIFILGACSEGQIGNPRDGATDLSTGMDTGADAQMCLADPNTVAARCAATYDAQIQAAASRCASSNQFNQPRAGRCGGYLVSTEPFFLDPGTTCYYDPTTKAFVAYRYCSDSPSPNDGCFCWYAGQAISPGDNCPDLGTGNPDERQPICPADGGTASDTRVD